MLSLTKKINTLYKMFKNINIMYNKSTDTYEIKIKSNILLNSDKDIITICKGEYIIQTDTMNDKKIHLNPVENVKLTKEYENIENLIEK